MGDKIRVVHYVDPHGNGTHAVCGWEPPADYAGTTVFLSSATCLSCIAAIQARITALAASPRGGAAPRLEERR